MTVLLGIMGVVSIPGVVLLLFGLAVIDRIGSAANRRLRLPWRRSEDGRPLAAAGIDELHALYYAAKRHELDQRQTSLMLREEEGDGAPPRSKVDLDTGTAVIRMPPPARHNG
ncbi:hypothetical protein SAMN04489712_102535 [Thermomonospora echinospora]|uniref:Uncharacterized protein n=1 Tax=Thermomonospora echinospora TaxID=1992 RepID=A0A1H5W0I1_9ACTN|nr:DUF6191 domain-containing protein [Thermomonospora echinospora]SEF92736.1 hypothetical protein SAMN04489712_102535 [Thermomonospora echinospora]